MIKDENKFLDKYMAIFEKVKNIIKKKLTVNLYIIENRFNAKEIF